MKIENLGSVVYSSFGQGAAIRQYEGKSSICFVGNGLPAVFYEFDLFTGELLFSRELENQDCVWAITRNPDGEVYFSGTNDGILYRYRGTGQLDNLGVNPANNWVINLVWEEQFVWGGTYPNSKLFSYNHQTGEFKDYGTMAEHEQYSRGIARDGDWLYVSTGSRKHFFKYNLVTGEQVEIQLDKLTGSNGFLDRLWLVDQYLFVASDFIDMYVYDRRTMELVDQFSFDNLLLTDHPLDPQLVLYKDGASLRGWHKKERKAVTVVDGGLPVGRCKALEYIKHNDNEFIALVTVNAEQALINLSDMSISRSMLKIEPQPLLQTCLEVAPDGAVYVGGYHRGLSKYNPDTNEIEWTVGLFPQSEGMTFHNNQVYFGTYTKAHLYKYNPEMPVAFDWSAEGNPSWLGQIQHQQDRPFTMTAGDHYVFAGTVPDYGLQGGALAVYNTRTNELETFPQVVENQSILGLAYWKGLIFGGTSVWGGLGGEPYAGPAKIFVWDVEKKQKIAEFIPQIPGAAQQPLMIGELMLGPDGLIWGADDGTIFAFDPVTYEIVKSKIVFPTEYAYSKWRPIVVRFGTNGLLYTTLARKIIVLNPETLEHRQITDEIVGNMAIDASNRIYINKGSELVRITMPDNLLK
ncbi:hypothetical protein [Paenibacillus sp. GXUN7292]|uniref:hypothetical protein n=1 Tax=Paenibacillus sp. GXUN7292 TaxID=3422499 RepID=UPI003D7DA381